MADAMLYHVLRTRGYKVAHDDLVQPRAHRPTIAATDQSACCRIDGIQKLISREAASGRSAAPARMQIHFAVCHSGTLPAGTVLENMPQVIDQPAVCVITAMRNCAQLVPSYRRMIEAFDPRPRRVVIGLNDSTDETSSLLAAWQRETVDVLEFDVLSFATNRPLFPRERSVARAAHLAEIRNRTIDHALRAHDWTHAFMHDATKRSPPDLPGRLLTSRADIVAPLVLRRSGDHVHFYDTWCFRDEHGAEYSAERPPVFPLDHPGPAEIRAMAVGGVYMVRRPIFEAGLRLGTLGAGCCDSVRLCVDALAAGYQVGVRRDLAAWAFAWPQEGPPEH